MGAALVKQIARSSAGVDLTAKRFGRRNRLDGAFDVPVFDADVTPMGAAEIIVNVLVSLRLLNLAELHNAAVVAGAVDLKVASRR